MLGNSMPWASERRRMARFHLGWFALDVWVSGFVYGG